MGLFDKFTRDPEDDGKTDFFESDIKPDAPKPPKTPQPDPDDPSYWEKDESEWEHLKLRRRWILALGGGLLIVVAGLVVGFYLRYFSPYIDDAVEYGYIEHVERRGTLFHTYEGVLIPYRELHDTTRVYRRDFIFSAATPQVATELKKYELSHRPVRVGYRQYHATVPWRGSSKIVVTRVDTVDASTILPPEFRPEIFRDE